MENTEIFIQKVSKIHNNIYDYSKTKYTIAQNSIIIICKEHGEFKQKACVHLRGHGCPQCSGRGKLNKELFIKKARKTHGDKYDYNHVVYFNCNVKVIIVCKEHGPFLQGPSHHIYGDGCPGCKSKKAHETQKDTIHSFIEKSRNIHGDKYDYSHIKTYVNRFTSVPIKCKKHNWIFEQKPNDHLDGCGCRKCACNGYSKIAIDWLNDIAKKENIEIQHAENKGEYEVQYILEGTTYRIRVDGFCEKTNTAYQFHGCLWHSHIGSECKSKSKKLWDHNKIHPVTKEPCSYRYNKTLEQEDILKLLGYNLVVIWECEYNIIMKSLN